MNKYLEKLATALPLRHRAEMVIFKDGKVLVTHGVNKEGDNYHAFPGGGLDGNSPEDAARKECLEEVGVKVKNVKNTGITNLKLYDENTVGFGDGSQEEKFKGSFTHVFTADYDGINKKHLGGEDGEVLPYSWENKDNALNLVKKVKNNRQDPSHRIEVLKKHWRST